jgi:hypothetical protein
VPGEPGSETWGGDSWKYGGASTWITGSYDPELNLIYWGTGNPGPDYNGDVRPGDNLYSCSLLALDADTGKLKWYFQFTRTTRLGRHASPRAPFNVAGVRANWWCAQSQRLPYPRPPNRNSRWPNLT